ncbi:MAG: AAA family ATPase [Pacificimonas sp.]
MTGTVHLIVGNVGAGKTTYARRLAVERPTHIISNDPWYKTLFQPDHQDGERGYEWVLERTQRIEAVAIDEAEALTALDLDVVLDLGFFGQAQRERVRTELQKRNLDVEVHYLDVSKERRWQHVEMRNASSDTLVLPVDRATFEFCETIFEPFDETESASANIVTIE